MSTSDEEPDVASSETAERDTPASADRAWREWMMISVGLIGLMSILATIVAVMALANPSTPAPAASTGVNAAMTSSATPASTAAPAPAAEAVKLTIKSDDEHGKLGPGGTWHDAFLPANFTVHAGAKVTVTVYNYDTGSHTFTSSTLTSNVMNEMIRAGTEKAPSKTTFTFTAPSQTGKYLWWCAMPCDPWAMTHIGYMRGYVTVVA